MKRLYLCDQGRLAETAALCRSNDLGIEAQAFYQLNTIGDTELVNKHRNLVRGLKGVSLHAPIFGDGRTFLRPGTDDRGDRRVVLDAFRFAYETIRLIGGGDLVLHHAYDPKADDRQEWLSRFTSFWREFMREQPSDVSCHLENMLEHGPELLMSVLDSIGDSNVDVCLDVGHVHANSETPVLAWIQRLGDRIGYVHLHDNHGQSDEHLGLGMGSIPMEELCQALEEYAPQAKWAIECKQEYRNQSITWLRNKGYM